MNKFLVCFFVVKLTLTSLVIFCIYYCICIFCVINIIAFSANSRSLYFNRRFLFACTVFISDSNHSAQVLRTYENHKYIYTYNAQHIRKISIISLLLSLLLLMSASFHKLCVEHSPDKQIGLPVILCVKPFSTSVIHTVITRISSTNTKYTRNVNFVNIRHHTYYKQHLKIRVLNTNRTPLCCSRNKKIKNENRQAWFVVFFIHSQTNQIQYDMICCWWFL